MQRDYQRVTFVIFVQCPFQLCSFLHSIGNYIFFGVKWYITPNKSIFDYMLYFTLNWLTGFSLFVQKSCFLSDIFRYLPCNSHHVRESEDRQPRGQQFQIQRTPQLHIQRPQAAPARFTAVSNRRGSPFPPVAIAATSFSTSTPIVSQPASPARSALAQNTLNENELDTTVPIFGCNLVQLQVRDLLNISPAPSTLNRIRNDLRQYIVSTLCLEAPVTDENITSVSVFSGFSYLMLQLAVYRLNS